MRSMRTKLMWAGAALVAALGVAVALVSPGPGPATATGGNSITSPDTGGAVGTHTSLALDASGYPVVSYRDETNGNLKMLHCDDPNCTGGGESVTLADAAGSVGQYTSLELDASGYPVVSYHDVGNIDLKVLHCNDANCDGAGESITSPDSGTWDGEFTSLALDPSGYPVVSYLDLTNWDLKVLHCNDASCSGGDETITSPDTGAAVGHFTSLALDGSGNPVVSYYDFTNGDLKVMHCNDANCSGGGESITSPDTGGSVGKYTSLALDASGYPVVSYWDETNDDLKVLHCNDVNCDGVGESITSPDTGGSVGKYTSLALDASGYPVVSYWDWTNIDLKVLRCGNANCTSDNSITSPDTGGDVGDFTSLALDASGNPVVSYHDLTNGDLKVLHCGDADCTGAKPTPTPTAAPPRINVTNVGQYALPKTCFDVRDDLQNPLFTVCDNDFQGPPENDPVCVPDGVCDDEDPADGQVQVTVDPAAYHVQVSKPALSHTADPSKLTCDASTGKCSVTFLNTPLTRPWHPADLTGPAGVPDGLVRVNDILYVVNSYFIDKPFTPTPTP